MVVVDLKVKNKSRKMSREQYEEEDGVVEPGVGPVDDKTAETEVDTSVRRIVKPVPGRVLSVYTVDELACVPADRVVAAVTASPAGSSDHGRCYVVYFKNK